MKEDEKIRNGTEESQELTIEVSMPGSSPRILVDAMHIYEEPDGTINLLLMKVETSSLTNGGFVTSFEDIDEALSAHVLGAYALSPSTAKRFVKQFAEFGKEVIDAEDNDDKGDGDE